MIDYFTSCFNKRNPDMKASNQTIFNNLEAQPDLQFLEDGINQRRQSGQEINVNIFDLDTLQKYFNEQFQLNQEIEDKYNNDGTQISEMRRKTQNDMENSQLRKIEEFEMMSQSKKDQLLNQNSLKESNNIINQKLDASKNQHDLNIQSEDFILQLIQDDIIISFSLKNKDEKQKMFDLMMKNVSKINKSHQLINITDDFKINTSSGLVLINKEIITEQKNLISFLIKEVGTSIFRGKSLSDVSLPVNVFESETILTRICKSFLYSNHFFKNIKQLDHIEVFRKVIAQFISQNCLQTSQHKPLNSLNGETHSAYILDQDNTYVHFQADQISHHPPISQIYLSGEGYRVIGSLCIESKIKFNSIVGYWKNNLKFQTLDAKNKVIQEIKIFLPIFEVIGTIWGQRSFNFNKQAMFFDYDNNLFGFVNFGDHVSSNVKDSSNLCLIDGEILKITKKLSNIIQQKINNKEAYKVKELKKSEIEQTISKISGNWVEQVKIDGREYWNRQDIEQGLYMVDSNALPSDSIFRQDIYFLRLKQMKLAQLAKDQQQALNKKDKMLRNNRTKKQIKK